MDAMPIRTHEEKTTRPYNSNKIPQALPPGAIIYGRHDEFSLSLCLEDRQLEQTQAERLLGLGVNPSLSWSSHVANLRKNLLKRVTILARIKKFLPVKYRIILFNASIKPILEYCVSFWGSCNAELLDEIF